MRYDNASGLYLPRALGKVIGGEYVPDKGVSWPKAPDNAAGIIQAVGSVADYANTSFDQGGAVNPPAMVQIAALQATLESTTGVSLSQLVSMAQSISALANATNTVQTVAAVTQLVNGALDIVVSVAGAAGAAASATAVVPVLGQLIGVITDVMVFFLKEAERYRQAVVNCQTDAEVKARAMCQRLLTQARPLPTEGQQPQPSDFFRPVFYAIKERKPLPLTAASLYVMLCGGETQGEVVGLDRARWRQVVDEYKKKSGNNRIGVPTAMQRKMWSLIKGIMSGVNYPQLGAPVRGDNGRALMPILQDLSFNLYRVGAPGPYQLPSRGQGFGIDDGFMSVLSREVARQHYFSQTCPYEESPGLARGAQPEGAASCRQFVDLGPSFIQGLRGYQNALQSSGLLRNDGTWNLITFKRVLTPAAKKKAILLLRGGALKRLTVTSHNARTAAKLSTSAAAARANDWQGKRNHRGWFHL